MKFITKFIVLTLITSCSSKQFTLDQYSNYRIKFAKQKIVYPNNDFLIFIPKHWEWKVETYENQNVILGIDAGSKLDKNGFVDIISIQKFKSFVNNKDLNSEIKYWQNLIIKNPQNGKLIESGYTESLYKKSYFFHTKYDTNRQGESEIISFILESEIEGVFYNLTASVSQSTDLKKNMSILIQSLMTFEIQNK
ncbi:hypothetical protein [Robertkochia solimangrovi]|uniref:hypothetical protein n=1 Tax=Robertkochia solimangrovi TaxID=2213046 RepID=UPI00117F875D|nr:hypothetical protein [Robertkochia solimangrovi]TRZ42490.1 hypothetical protein DMZ48_13375 [Robertkochia solimangrovi]